MTHRTQTERRRTGLMESPCDCLADHPQIVAARVVLNGDCWEWTLRVDPEGYGRITHYGRTWTAHRFTYLAMVGSIPSGLVLDHLCRNRICVNPDHLEPVTDRTNTMRSWAVREHARLVLAVLGQSASRGAGRNRAPRPFVHGASAYVNHACRCDVCRAGNAARQRDYQLRRRSA